jgi:hypothetical protein
MKADNEGYVSIEEAVEWVMKSQHCDRARALRLLQDAISTGHIRATGISSETGKRERIPPDPGRAQ